MKLKQICLRTDGDLPSGSKGRNSLSTRRAHRTFQKENNSKWLYSESARLYESKGKRISFRFLLYMEVSI